MWRDHWGSQPDPDGGDSLTACVVMFVIALVISIGGIWILGVK